MRPTLLGPKSSCRPLGNKHHSEPPNERIPIPLAKVTQVCHYGLDMKSLRRVLKRAAGPVIFFLGLFVILRWFEQSQVYHPSRSFAADGSELGRPFENVWFQALDGVKLHGWFFPADTTSPRAQIAFVFCHGNAGNISHRLETAAAMLQSGASVFMFDYRGYGQSTGRPSEEGTYLDAQAAYASLRAKGFESGNLIAFGESLGGAVATELSRRESCGGLVLHSTFTSILDIGADLFPWLPVRWIARIKYDTLSKLPTLQIPVLVMHSPEDDLIPFRHAQRNFDAIRSAKLLVELEGDHNYPVGDKYVAAVERFFELLQTSRRQAPPDRDSQGE